MKNSWFNPLIDAVGVVAGVLFFGLVVLVCIDVGVRYGKFFSMPWAFDVAEIALYATTFIGAPWVLRDRGHISVDIVVELFPPGPRQRVDLAANVIGAAVCITMMCLFARLVWRSFSEGALVHKTLIFPEWVLFAIAPVAFFLMSLIYVRTLLCRRATESLQVAEDGL